MTASVSTRGMKGACFTDEEREGMYLSALSFYIEHLLQKDERYAIVFVENSGWDLQSLQNRIPPCDEGRVEWISLPPDEFDISKGKGYNELLMITKAVQRSEIVQRAKFFFKVTGRYPIYNLKRFADKAYQFIQEQHGDLYADIKDHKLYDRLGLGWCGHAFDCRLFGVKVDYYMRNMAPLYVKCDDYKGCLLEGVLFEAVNQRCGKLTLRFDREPHFGGLEGSNIAAVSFTKKQDSLLGKVKRMVGNFIRMFLPWFKF